MFEKASRLKLRFETPVGVLHVEDLWDLPLISARGVSLDDVARSLHRTIKDSAEESFVTETTGVNEKLQLGFDIVKHVIDVKKAEKEAAESKVAKKAEKSRILSLISDKKDAALSEKSVEELQAMVEAL